MATEKQPVPMVEAVEVAPPAYAEIVVTEEALEALEKEAECPAWIRRLPVTLPVTHALLSIPSMLFFARSLSEAVLFAAFFSFVLFAATTVRISRALHRNDRARAPAARALATAATTTILWPLAALIVLSPALQHRRGCAMRMLRGHGHHHAHRHSAHPVFHQQASAVHSTADPAIHIVNGRPVIASHPVEPSPAMARILRGGANGAPAAVVFSSKGARVLIGSGPDADVELDTAIAVLVASAEQAETQALQAKRPIAHPAAFHEAQELQVMQAMDHYVVSSKGIKALSEDEVAALGGVESVFEQQL